ncbi:hypothetical protein BU26DRAFT_570325 [Trematosphaeria pertusa]|uniref:Uncharacterized protein n=1 Tax=Trematosphaeria pertusa TaxID=390896 RepID=A0A6A6HXZ8_9PLEO|nr:uncharacterized protein BU26DRAFT_570325 [Trematosphaeria pertusa]KAF2242897.1 hypothetical protein BU26DRAFT_570325 [Trematosphaeria pertusa]
MRPPAILALLLSATALARPKKPAGMPGGVYFCNQPKFRGECAWRPQSNYCYISGTGDEAPDSIGPDKGGYCIIYQDDKCGEETKIREIRYPGIERWLERFGSIQCFVGEGRGVWEPES